MKKSFLCFLLLALSVGLFSCTPKKDNSTPTSTFTATVNGASFVANSVNTSDVSGSFLIVGTTATGQEITISIPDLSASTTNYTIDSIYHQAFYYVNTSTTPTTARTGTFTINFTGTNSGTGTFSFTCKDGTVVTNGAYKANW